MAKVDIAAAAAAAAIVTVEVVVAAAQVWHDKWLARRKNTPRYGGAHEKGPRIPMCDVN